MEKNELIKTIQLELGRLEIIKDNLYWLDLSKLGVYKFKDLQFVVEKFQNEVNELDDKLADLENLEDEENEQNGTEGYSAEYNEFFKRLSDLIDYSDSFRIG